MSVPERAKSRHGHSKVPLSVELYAGLRFAQPHCILATGRGRTPPPPGELQIDRALAKQLKSGNVQNGSSRNPPPVALTGIVY